MAKLYNVTLYYYTKFGKGNLPDSPARLAPFESKTFSAVYLRQDYGTVSLKLDATWEDVRGADYAKMDSADGTLFYALTVPPAMLSDHTAQIDLTLDPLCSVGGIDGLTVDTGWASRAHTDDDQLFGNVVPEPWGPSNPLVIRQNDTMHEDTEADSVRHTIVIATCDLREASEYQAVVIKAASDTTEGDEFAAITIPVTPTVKAAGQGDIVTTTLGMPAGPGSAVNYYHYTLPGMWAFLGDAQNISDGMQAVHNLGLDTAIIAAYTVPANDVGVGTTVNGLIADLTGFSNPESPDQPYVYGNVKNKKAIAIYNTYTVTSIASGDTNEFDARDIYHDGDTKPKWAIYSDPAPSGTTYCAPLYFERTLTKIYEQAVAGMAWLSAGITFAGASGGSLGILNASRRNTYALQNLGLEQQAIDNARTQNYMQLGAQALDFGISALTGLAAFEYLAPFKGAVNSQRQAISSQPEMARRTAMLSEAQDNVGLLQSANPSGLLGGVTSAISNSMNLNLQQERAWTGAYQTLGDNIFSSHVAAKVAAPTLAFPVSVNAASYVGNAFTVIHATLSDNDLQRFDDFLSAFGYAVDERFRASQLNNRQSHNYIKTVGAQVSKPGYPRWLLDMVGALFDEGCRIWHTTPSQSALFNNPIKE